LLNLDRFIIRLLVGADSTSKLEEEAGLRSQRIQAPCEPAAYSGLSTPVTRCTAADADLFILWAV
jgi:hypothetical protein